MSGYSMGTAEAVDQLNQSAERIEKQLEGIGGSLDRIARGTATTRLEGELVRIGDTLERIGDGLADLAGEHGAIGQSHNEVPNAHSDKHNKRLRAEGGHTVNRGQHEPVTSRSTQHEHL